MNIHLRTCASCTSFYPEEGATTSECWNLVSFIEKRGTPEESSRMPKADDCCNDHKTLAEDEADDGALATFWQRIRIPDENRGAQGNEQ